MRGGELRKILGADVPAMKVVLKHKIGVEYDFLITCVIGSYPGC